MELVVIEERGNGKKCRKLINTLTEPDFRSKYLQEDGTPFFSEDSAPVDPVEEPEEEEGEAEKTKKKTRRKA